MRCEDADDGRGRMKRTDGKPINFIYAKMITRKCLSKTVQYIQRMQWSCLNEHKNQMKRDENF